MSNVIRLPITNIPRTHKQIVGQFKGETARGHEFFIDVREPDTTNEQAKFLQSERIRAAAEARAKGVPMGVNVPLKANAAAVAQVSIRTQGYDGTLYRIPVQANVDGSYSVNGKRHEDLRVCSQYVMAQFEMQYGAAYAPAAQTRSEAPAYGMRMGR